MKNPLPGRLLVLGFEGPAVPGELVSFAKKHGLGGVILFARNCPDAVTVKRLVSEIKTRLGQRVLVMIDQEGGRVERIRDGVQRLPSARELASMPLEKITELSRRQAVDLKKLGLDVNLAPVADVTRPGESGVIGDRAFGSHPETVANSALAYMEGQLKGGIIPCAKHFPGHGSSVTDTHLGAGTVPLPRKTLMETDAHPFKKLIEGRVPMVMACHLAYPEVDPRPAVFSPVWIKKILRGELGFTGVIITDDMEMGAAKEAGDEAAAALSAINAGMDMLIYGKMLKPYADVEKIAETLARELAPDVMDAALGRIASLGAAP